jgi:L-rhamnose mutarotase
VGTYRLPAVLTPDYSIHYFAPLCLLIAHMRYIGDDFDADMASIKESETTRKWWAVSVTNPGGGGR